MTVIVQMKEPPLLVYRRTNRAPLWQPLTVAQREALDRHAAGLRQSHRDLQATAARQGIAIKARRDHTHATNGFAADIRWGDRHKITALPGVAVVALDRRVYGTLQDSVPLIRANRVWTELGATGEGVVVGMIDSGIDYTHPDLGGGLGVGCKVIGGYDFVNDDSDPWDDAGHGTHTAGIVAVDGLTTKGVAPGARLMAIKVLGAQNWRSWSDVLAGLDYAIDPGGNPATDDALDLLSMSIGGAGDPDDPICQAVDNLVAGGIPCIVAAGNGGPGYNTMESPGAARSAITVGGSSKQDLMYYYSSRGYYARDAQIKPDVMAPGVSTCSTVPGGGHECWNGTSMATPHVAGVAALLKQLHPTWGPAEMRSALMGRAVDLGFDVFSQGAGRVDAYAAALAAGGFSPSSLHFGILDPNAPLWVASRVVQLTNLYSTSLTYTMSAVETTGASGVTLTVNPAQVTLASGASLPITLQVSVDNSLAPARTSEPFAYQKRLLAESTAGAVSAPFAFVDAAAQLILHYDADPWMITIHDRGQQQWSSPWNPGRDVRVLFPAPGTYDVVTVLGDGVTVIVREQVAVTRLTELTISTAEAVNRVDFIPRDEKGTALDMRYWWRVIRFRDDPYLWTAVGSGVDMPGYCSPLSSDYRIERNETGACHANTYPVNTKQYFIRQHQIGLTAPLTMTNDPASLRPVHFVYHAPATQIPFEETPHDAHMPGLTANWWSALPSYNSAQIMAPFRRTLYFKSPGSYPYAFNFHRFYDFTMDSATELSCTPFLRMNDSGALEGFRRGQEAPTANSMAGRWEVGLTPAWWSGAFANWADRIRVQPSAGWEYHLFFNQYDDPLAPYAYPYT